MPARRIVLEPRRRDSVTSFQPAHRVSVREPQIGAHDVVFRWDVSPASELYRQTEFTLTFPPSLDLRTVPRALWWRIAFVCLHPHWALLRPCCVEIPIRLEPGEREFWSRMIENVVVQLEAYGGATRPGPAVEIAESGSPLPPVRLTGRGDRAAVCFSGGKDSLALTGLLAELTERPLLVMTTSPVPWARDQVGVARARAQAEIAERLLVDLVEVRSDYRMCWDYEFSMRDGCTLGVHELSDILLFQSATLAAAAASGIGRAYMASEADIQYNAPRAGHVVLHRGFMSGVVTQGALDALVRDFGLRLTSLTYPLHMTHVQALLFGRYHGLVDLQFSCWQAPEGAQACSACQKCFEIALTAFVEGVSPRAVGIDPVSVLCASSRRRLDPSAHAGPKLHQTRSGGDQVLRCLQAVPTEQIRRVLELDPVARDDPRLGEAVAIYARLRAEALAVIVPPDPGYIAGFLELVPDDLRERLRAIFDEYFAPADEREFADTLERGRALTRWITEPLTAGHR